MPGRVLPGHLGGVLPRQLDRVLPGQVLSGHQGFVRAHVWIRRLHEARCHPAVQP